MPTDFSSFPSEIRNQIYELLLVLAEPIEITGYHLNSVSEALPQPLWSPTRKGFDLCPAILAVNKQIYREAAPLLYSMNSFMVGESVASYTYEPPRAILASFLDRIGSQNAGFLRRICIAFPSFDGYYTGNVALQGDSILALELIRDKCINLATLETSLETTTVVERSLDSLNNPRAAAEALALVDACFKEISSLEELVVNVYDDAPSLDLRDEMRGRGWTVKVTEREELESVGEFDSYDDYNYDYWAENPREEADWWGDFDRRNRD
ncbi:hypothetical protein B0O99DRAFT_590614 [Bisporella sp. PMI_857]|nr:hypothetical protein B0O99DRAFT_590614 [Bisporella sp. PMI_857]